MVKNSSRYIQTARTAGCPDDQIARFVAGGYVATPKQLAFHAACRQADAGEHVQVGFGGARGPGKSHAMLAQLALDDCQRLPEAKVLLLRKVGKAVRESFEGLRRSVLGGTDHEYRRGDGTISFPNGSKIILGHFKDERDIDSYLGLEYDVIGIEEASTLSLTKYKAIRTCCRTSKRDWTPRAYSNANPGGVGHAWFKARFVQGSCPFIPALVTDNPFIDAGYVKVLDDLTGWLKRAWRYGDWDIMAGQYFSTWRPKAHVVEPFRMLRKNWQWTLALDYGWQHPTTALLLAQGAGGVYIVAEYGASKRLPPHHSRSLLGMLGRLEIQRDWLRTTVIGADAFRRRSDGKCTADEYEQLGWRLETADMSRIEGATEVLRRLGEPDPLKGEDVIPPSLHVFDTCPRLIEQLPMMQHDMRRPEDVLKTDIDEDGYGGDDFYDALRYGLMELAKPAVEMAPGLEWRKR